ncbi:AI-2E family transporter [Candidatus Woesearchaeota archaeon]|nr:AI-2E family transporter [Candidatus Woesearchaeota archaeon]
MVTKKTEKSRNLDLLMLLLYLLAMLILYVIFKPYFSALMLGAIIIIFLYPLNKWFQKKIKNKYITSTIMLLIAILIIFIPAVFVTTNLIGEAGKAYTSFKNVDMVIVTEKINEYTGLDLDIMSFIKGVNSKLLNYVSNSAFSLIGSITDIILSTFVMFFFIFYGFKEGDKIQKSIINILPIKKEQKVEVESETKKVIYGVMYGQFLVALIQGILGGIGFWIFGVPNPILWGFIMVLFAFLPFLGTPIIWLPASIIVLLSGNTASGIGLIIYSGILVTNIDNVIKPKIISDNSGIHPVLVLVGTLGGLAAFGLIGFILGPMLVALSTLIIKIYIKEVNNET